MDPSHFLDVAGACATFKASGDEGSAYKCKYDLAL